MKDCSGQRLDKYHLIRLLGSGSFGDVYLAEQVYRKTQVAVKVLPQLANDDIASFLNEARTVVLRHPNIVQVLDFGIDNRIPFLVMEYIPNGTLRQLYPKGTRIPLDDLIPYTKQIANALNYAHDENLIHRDVKPENILLRLNNEVLLSDFGIATIARSSHSRSVLKMAGTLAYMAPEQIEGKPVLASDQYALGIIVYEYLSGKRPFNGSPIEIATQHMVTPPPSLRSKVPTLSPDIEQVVLTALAKEPSKRFASVRAFAHALEQASKPPKQPEPVMPHLISPAPSVPPLPSTPKEQILNVTPLSTQQPIVLFPNTILPTSEKPVLASSLHPAFFGTSQPIVQAEISPVGRKGSANSTRSTLLGSKIIRHRLFYPLLASVILLLIGIIGSGVYYYSQSITPINVNQTLQNAQLLIAKANNEVNTNPTAALSDLAAAQKQLRSVQQNSSYSDTQRSKALHLLQGDLTTGTQNAIRNYNKQSFIAPLCSPTATSSTLSLGTTGTQPKAIALVQGKSSPVLYALGADGAVYFVNNNSLIPVHPSNLGTAQIQNMVSNGSQLVLLLAQMTKPNDPTSISYILALLPVDQGAQGQQTNQLNLQLFASIDPKLVQNGQMPKWIAASGSDIYVVFGSNSTQTSAVTVDYTSKGEILPAQASTSYTTSLSAGIESIAAFPNQQLFFLLADGSIKSLQLNGSNPNHQAISVLTQNAITQPLPVTAKTFTWQTAVPTAATGSTKSLTVAGTTSSSALAVGVVNNEPHLFILDAVQHRVLELTAVVGGVVTATPTVHVTATSIVSGGGVVAAPTPVTLKLVEQYASSTLFNQSKSIAVDAQSSTTNVLTQGQGPAFNLVAFSPNQQDNCD